MFVFNNKQFFILHFKPKNKMITFKIHIAKQIVAGKIIPTVAECGRKSFTPNGSVNQIYKSKDFIMVFKSEKDACCSICLERAKKQNRL